MHLNLLFIGALKTFAHLYVKNANISINEVQEMWFAYSCLITFGDYPCYSI